MQHTAFGHILYISRIFELLENYRVSYIDIHIVVCIHIRYTSIYILTIVLQSFLIFFFRIQIDR